MLRDAVDIELIDANPAARLRVRPADPRLDPERGPMRRRAVPPGEIRAFIHTRQAIAARLLLGAGDDCLASFRGRASRRATREATMASSCRTQTR